MFTLEGHRYMKFSRVGSLFHVNNEELQLRDISHITFYFNFGVRRGVLISSIFKNNIHISKLLIVFRAVFV